jgi:hypothetical protein
MSRMRNKSFSRVTAVIMLILLSISIYTPSVSASPAYQTVPTMPPPSLTPTTTAPARPQPSATHPQQTSIPPSQTAAAAFTETLVATTSTSTSTPYPATQTSIPAQPTVTGAVLQVTSTLLTTATNTETPTASPATAVAGGNNFAMVGFVAGGITVVVVILLGIWLLSRRPSGGHTAQ